MPFQTALLSHTAGHDEVQRGMPWAKDIQQPRKNANALIIEKIESTGSTVLKQLKHYTHITRTPMRTCMVTCDHVQYQTCRPLPGLGLGGAAPGITVGVRHWLCGLPCVSFPCRAWLQLKTFATELRCSLSPLPRAARLLQAPERRHRPCKLLLYRLSKRLRPRLENLKAIKTIKTSKPLKA